MKTQLKALVYINSIFVFAVQMFLPLYALYVQKIETAVYHISGIWSFYILSAGIFILIASRYENKKKNAPAFLIAGFLFRGLGWLAYIFASSLWHLYAIQLLMALGEACGTPTFNFLYSNYLSRGHSATDWGFNSGIACFVTAAASFSGGMIVYFYGFTSLLAIMIFLSLVSALSMYIFRKEFIGFF